MAGAPSRTGAAESVSVAKALEMSTIQRLQNSPLTSWCWSCYLNRRTQEYKLVPLWRRFLCVIGQHRGICQNGQFECSHCDFADSYET